MVFKTKEEALQQEGNNIIYDIDEALVLCNEFLKKVEIHRKDFRRMSKKLNEKNKEREINKFIEGRLKKPFLYYFADKFFVNNEVEKLGNDLNIYIAGLFITDGAQEKNLKENRDKIVASTIVEMTKRAAENEL